MEEHMDIIQVEISCDLAKW